MVEQVPQALWLVESYLNSINVETSQDDLESIERFRRWLDDHGRTTATVTQDDLELAVALRDELRQVVRAHHDGDPHNSPVLDDLAARIPLRVRFPSAASPGAAGPSAAAGPGAAASRGAGPGPGAVRLEPIGSGVTGVLGEVLAAIVAGEGDGTWRRLKICREDTCQVVFYDRSKNASRCWCSMQVCGNRNKTRAYRRRAASTR